MNPTLQTTLRRIIRLRPLSVSILEKEAGYRCWEHLEEPLSAFCRKLGLDQGSILIRLANLAPVPPDTDWMVKPIYYLIDYLTRSHADFREKDMQAIAALLEREHLPPYPDGYVVKLLVQEFRHFQQDFLKHMDEEEEFLFPKILRNEACFRHPRLGPEVYRGSVDLYLKLETHSPETEFKHMIESIREKMRNQMMHKPAADLAHDMQIALQTFEGRLIAHTELEASVLFPRAGRLEQELYESSAPGLSRYPGDQ